jgi:hypothetical protein
LMLETGYINGLMGRKQYTGQWIQSAGFDESETNTE